MQMTSRAARAYQASSGHRSLREQEADVFRRANGALRATRDAGPTARIRALADNRRLWGTVFALMRDPHNALPEGLRAQIVSIGLAVQRDMEGETPDWDFLIGINDQIAAGLSGQG
ncbi:flagellar biosynthesis regulator FlaF [Ralstonia sp. VS2407]